MSSEYKKPSLMKLTAGQNTNHVLPAKYFIDICTRSIILKKHRLHVFSPTCYQNIYLSADYITLRIDLFP